VADKTRLVMTTSSPSEANIRDWLAANLSFLESGLTLIRKEQFLPNDKGANGFVDIFAKDVDGRVVVIEIKRREAAAREAITELAKYAALLRISRGLRKSEIRFVIVSTAWDQLLAPFSEWVDSTDYQVSGFKVQAAADGALEAKTLIQPMQLGKGRLICRRQFALYYKTDKDATLGIKKIKKMCKRVGLEDFLIYKVEYIEKNYYDATRALIFAQQLHEKDYYLPLLRKRLGKEEFEELVASVEDLIDPDDKLDELADALPDFTEIECETAEICHPEKVVQRTSAGIWKRQSVARAGLFARDERLSDDLLWYELSGLGGTSFHHFVSLCRTSDKAKIAEIRKGLSTTLFNNPTWRHTIEDYLQYASGFDPASIAICVFDAFAILDSLFALHKQKKTNVLPVFGLTIDSEVSPIEVLGTVRWNGKTDLDLDSLIAKHFHGNFFDGYLMARHFGGQKAVNEELMKDLGLLYVTDVLDSSGIRFDAVVRGNVIVGQGSPSNHFLSDFVQANSGFLDKLVSSFSRYTNF